MKTIRFTKTSPWLTGRDDATTYEAGSVHTLRDDLADRWLKRGVAEIVEKPVRGAASTPPAEDASAGQQPDPQAPPAASQPAPPSGDPPPPAPPAAKKGWR